VCRVPRVDLAALRGCLGSRADTVTHCLPGEHYSARKAYGFPGGTVWASVCSSRRVAVGHRASPAAEGGSRAVARKLVKVLVCDHCPPGREAPATHTQTLTLGDGSWSLDLCEGCARKLDRVVVSWARRGRALNHAPASAFEFFSADYRRDARSAAQSRARENASRAPTRQAAGPAPPTPALPPATDDWLFTGHARSRLAGRDIPAAAALQAAAHPTVRRPGRRPGTALHQADGVKVVVVLASREILSVSRPHHGAEKYT